MGSSLFQEKVLEMTTSITFFSFFFFFLVHGYSSTFPRGFYTQLSVDSGRGWVG